MRSTEIGAEIFFRSSDLPMFDPLPSPEICSTSFEDGKLHTSTWKTRTVLECQTEASQQNLAAFHSPDGKPNYAAAFPGKLHRKIWSSVLKQMYSWA